MFFHKARSAIFSFGYVLLFHLQANVLRKWVSNEYLFGAIKWLVTDQLCNFINNLQSNIMKLFHVNYHFNTTYYPLDN